MQTTNKKKCTQVYTGYVLPAIIVHETYLHNVYSVQSSTVFFFRELLLYRAGLTLVRKGCVLTRNVLVVHYVCATPHIIFIRTFILHVYTITEKCKSPSTRG